MPADMIQKLRDAKNFRAASHILRQLKFALTDLALHERPPPATNDALWAIDREVSERTTVIPPLPEDRFLCGFQHIFAGGYAAGYYR